MFTPISKKYCKEPSLRYSSSSKEQQNPPSKLLGLHKSLNSSNSSSVTPVERKSTSCFHNAFFRSSENRKEKQHKAGLGNGGLYGNVHGSVQQEPLSSSRIWPDFNAPQEQPKSSDSECVYLQQKPLNSGNSYSKSAGGRKYSNYGGGVGRQKGYGNQLLSLRAELSEKELQLVEIQQQHNKLICRSTDAFKKLEVAIKTKDQVIWQLHQALQSKQHELDRHEKLFDEEKQVLLHKTQNQKNSQIEQKDTEIALLRAKNATQTQEMQQHEETIAHMKQQLEEKDKAASTPSPYVISKMDALMGQVQCLETSLQNKEAELESHKQLCNDLKTLVWKRECMIGQLQVAEQQLQAALARKTEAYNALEVLKDTLQDDKGQMEKKMAQLKKELEALGSVAINDRQLKEDIKIQEACLQNQRKQLHELQRALHAKDVALGSQSKKFHLQHEENQKLIEDYELLKQEYAALKQEKEQLEQNLDNLDELVASKIHQEIKIDIPMDEEIVEIPVEGEKDITQSPKSLTPKRMHKKAEPAPLKSPKKSKSTADNELLSIEEEIGRREKEWRHTEAKMRAELCRRIAQLNELGSFRPDSKQEAPGRPESRSQFTSENMQKKQTF